MGGACDNRDPVSSGDYDDGWGSPACSNRESSRVSVIRVPSMLYNLTVKAITVSGEEFIFGIDAGISEPLEDMQKAAGDQAKHLCWLKGQELKSFAIVELATADSTSR